MRTPTVLQMEAVECGAAALAIVLGYFGRFVPLEELREACGVSRDGSKAGSIVKVAKQYGLGARGFRYDAQKALSGPFPAIAFWNFNHFLVVEGTAKGKVFLNDPAIGPRSVPMDEFVESYSGVLLTFTREDGFTPGGRPPGVLSQLVRLGRPYLAQVGFIAMIGALLALPGFVLPGFNAIFVDQILVGRRTEWLGPLVLFMLGGAVLVAVLTWLKDVHLLRLRMQLSLRRSADFFWHVLRLPAAFFGQRYLGDIANRVGSVENIAALLTRDIGGSFVDGFTAVLVLVLMSLLSLDLAALALFAALMNVLFLRWLERARCDAAARVQCDSGKLYATSVIGLRTIETIKATGSEDDYFAKWAGHHARSVMSEQKMARLEQISGIAPVLLSGITSAVVLGLGGLEVMNGTLSLGALIAFQALFVAIGGPVQRMVEAASQTQQASAHLSRLDDVFRYPLDWRHHPPASPLPAPPLPAGAPGGLLLVDVSFGYNPLEPPLIEGFNLDVAPGGWVALVGGSGSGKSTIAKMVSGLYRPRHGEIYLDGRPITSFDRRHLASMVAMVDQEIALFRASLRDNICLWDASLPFEHLVAAARDAQMLDTIEAMPGYFDAWIEEGGRNLSGGQRQQLEIARALVMEPSLLILDEATSALDPITELAVIEALRRRGMTCIMVAHRLSTIRDADEIIVLERGRIVERGSHAALLAAGGAYVRLIREEQP
ncbi:NHLP family bacteriocin export ABC transporter peptidase/permease/ATPase subunit [Xanthobacter flavus]|uniref:NHLP family bacteriocin export ABC transporter peptidase/permease/ATPase subunit n=1 Tax=Xanthobacter flavus TaxID=281 RepID=UPI003727C1A7